MSYVYLSPAWFFGYDVFLEVGFAVISLLVGIYAFKIHKLTMDRQSRLFGYGFIFISVSYFVQSIVNFAIISKLNQDVCGLLRIQDVNYLNAVGIFFYMLLFMTGLSTLTYMTLRVRSSRTLAIILLITIISIIFSLNKVYVFYIISSLLLFFVFYHYLQNYLDKKRKGNLLALVAFGFLFISKVHFILSVTNVTFYMVGHLLEFVAYLLILINFLQILKK